MNSELFLRLEEDSISPALEEGSGNSVYKEVARICREKIRKAQVQVELNLATGIKQNKKLLTNT